MTWFEDLVKCVLGEDLFSVLPYVGDMLSFDEEELFLIVMNL